MSRAAPQQHEADPATAAETRQGRGSYRLAPRPYGVALADGERGGASLAHGKCDTCGAAGESGGAAATRSSRSSTASPAPTVGRADDPAEREADTMAEQALAGLPLLRPMRGSLSIRRTCAACSEEEDNQIHRKAEGGGDPHAGRAAPPSVASLLAQPGRSLDPATRGFFERRFGRSFADVAVHDGPAADQAAQAIKARAFTAGNHIAFARGQYSPHTAGGRALLAHELAHVAQQTPTVRRQPAEPAAKAASSTWLEPKSAAIVDVMAVYAKLPRTDIKQYFIVDGNRLTAFDKAGKKKGEPYALQRPGLVDVKGYYLGSPFYHVGWGWLVQTSTGEVAVEGLSPEGQEEAKKSTTAGQMLRLLDAEITVEAWIQHADSERFREENEHGLTGMAVVSTPLKTLDAKEKQGPVLSMQLPDWFKALKAKVEKTVADDRAANEADPNLPDRMFFYGSDKVQAQKGADAWTIEVEKGKREAYLTIVRKSWDEASDKDAYARQITAQLYNKIKLILDDASLQKEEQKEITEIDGTGEKKGSKWGWAVALKKRIEAQLAHQKTKEPEAKDFPDKLTLATVANGGEASAHLRVWVYEDKPVAPGALPQLLGGTLPVAVKGDDQAEDWTPIVRKAADALRRGAVTTDPNATGGDKGAAGGDPEVQPPYAARIHPVDLNPDLTTATVASNVFRMVVDVDSTHGGSLLHRTTIHMALSIGYSWRVYPLPGSLKTLMTASRLQGDTATAVEKTNDYVEANRTALGEPKLSYDADRDWDQRVKMSELGVGDYVIVGQATVGYPSDWNMKRQASVAALPFTIMTSEDLAKSSAYADSDALAKLKAEHARETDANKKDLLATQIADLEFRENNDLATITKKDIGDTQKLIDTAVKLRKFIESDWASNKEHDPLMLMFRLKAFDKEHNENLYGVFMIVRQIFDRRYDDKTAVVEYIKIVEKQRADLNALQMRSDRVTANPKLRKDKPLHRAVAALVKEDDGNLVPLILLVGHHVDSRPAEDKADAGAAGAKAPAQPSYKMLLLDVTFDSPKKGDMTYAGDERSDEASAVKSAFVEFGKDNKYGDGEIVYRLPQRGLRDKVPSITHWTEYLGYALAVLGIVLLIAGSILSAGALAPASAAAIGAIVTGLGIAAGVAGAALAARNIYKRVEKGTFELDAEFALDVVSIIGAAVQVLGTAGRLAATGNTTGRVATMTRTVGAVQRSLQIQRLDRLILIYDAVELGGNAILVSMKVHEDVEAIDKLPISDERKAELKQQVALEAVQSGAMLAYASFGKAGEIHGAIKARVENSRYKTFRQRGWVDEKGHPTDQAPPVLRAHTVQPGKPAPKAAQGEQAWKEVEVLGLAGARTRDGQHQVTITEKGRIIRCSDYCTDLRLKYGEVLERDPHLNKQMTDLEEAAKAAAKSGDRTKADAAAKAASDFEATLKDAEGLRKHLFGMTDKEIDAALESIEPGRITGGAKSGYKIDDVRIPKRQRRMIDVLDIMNPAELAELAKGGWKKAMERLNAVMGRKISDIPELEAAWNAARKDVLKGKEPKDYTRQQVIEMYKTAQRKFWENVRKDPKAVEFLKKQGFELPGEGGAALATLGPKGREATTRGNITDQERRISLDHIDEKAQGDNWLKALDADNLELMFQNANSWKEIVQVKFGMRDSNP